VTLEAALTMGYTPGRWICWAQVDLVGVKWILMGVGRKLLGMGSRN